MKSVHISAHSDLADLLRPGKRNQREKVSDASAWHLQSWFSVISIQEMTGRSPASGKTDSSSFLLQHQLPFPQVPTNCLETVWKPSALSHSLLEETSKTHPSASLLAGLPPPLLLLFLHSYSPLFQMLVIAMPGQGACTTRSRQEESACRYSFSSPS